MVNNAPVDVNILAHAIGMKELELIQLRQQVVLMNEHIATLTPKSGAKEQTELGGSNDRHS